ncbi:MAG: hypothetical protein HY703_00465 [Gemmatimonadetes bacterium]|nr:hypothetical protein [Gemmatimonadota bacterium]
MLLPCSFEEVSALRSGAGGALAVVPWQGVTVLAAPEVIADTEALLPRLESQLSVTTLAELQGLRRVVEFVVAHLKERMDAVILEQYVGAEEAVTAYFDYAYVLTVYERIQRMGQEMAALIELMTGRPPTTESARRITFPD